eukprot:1159930-Rhodomonas_salina.1
MSGTSIAYGAACLRACYAKSGTEVAYGAICLREVRAWCHLPTRSPVLTYAKSGTEVAYGATRRGQWYVDRQRQVLRTRRRKGH